MMVNFATGFGPTILKSSLCTDCEGDKFDVASSTSIALSDPLEYTSIYQSSALTQNFNLRGKLVTDVVCLSSSTTSSCATDLKFGAATYVSELEDNVSGIVGLWSANHSFASNDELLMAKLMENSDISE